MFSPEAAIHERTQTLRGNKRSRQRTASSDSLNARAREPKRTKRLPLGEDSFASPDSLQHANGSAERPTSRYPNGVGRRGSALDSSFDSSLAVRGKTSRREKRGTRIEDGVELTKTDTYRLTRDRNIPGVLQEIISTEPWHASLCAGLEWAVAFTQKRAIIWKYGHSRTLSSHDSGTHVIKFADASSSLNSGSRQDAFEALPVGTLVHDAGAGDLALLAVLPGGRVQYFESVRAADADATRSKAPSSEPLRGTIGGLYSGESITQVTDAEPDGFLLATNYGRLFHLSVRDPQGKPLIHTQHLKSPNTEKSGLFGSIRNALRFGGPSQDIVSINAIADKKGSHRNVLVATAKGVAQAWNIARHGPKTLESEWDLRPHIVEACRAVSPDLQDETPTLLDLTLIAREKDNKTPELHTVALTSFSRQASNKYFIVGLVLNEETVEIDVVHPVRSYDGPEATPSLVGRKFRPKLLVPKPGHTAFMVLDTRIIVVSLNRPLDTPDSQLHFEAKDIADNYEESIFYNQKRPYHSVGCAPDVTRDQLDNASCDVIVHGFGHIRMSAKVVNPKETRGQRRRKAIRSRLEQVVFFGSMPENFLDFCNESIWKNVTSEEIEAILPEVVNSIMDSSSPFIPPISPSMDLQLKHRIQAMQELNKFVQRWEIPVSTRWKLLWAAEKLAAAKAVFAIYNEGLAERQPDQRMLLEEICEMIPKDPQHIKEPGVGEGDRVRHFMTTNVAEMGSVIAWSQMTIDELYSDGLDSVDVQAPLVSQAGDIVIQALHGALAYREANIEAFGLGKDLIIESIYRGSYAEMDEPPWTCSDLLLEQLPTLVYMTTQISQKLDALELESDTDALLFKLAEDAPRLADIVFRAWEERCRWIESRPDEPSRNAVTAYRAKYDETRNQCLCWLSDIGLHLQSTTLAEKYQDMEALAMLTNRIRINADESWLTGSPEERDIGRSTLDEVDAKEDGYFDTYGDHWADSFFSRQIAETQSSRLLERYPHRQNFLTQFLRKRKQSDPRAYKLSWINEIVREKRFDEAADDLTRAQHDEQRLWVKQVEMSLAKLAKLAAVESQQLDPETGAKDVKKADQRIQIAKKQQDLYDWLKPILIGGIDESGAHLLVMEAYGSYVSGKPTLEKALAETLAKLVQRKVLHVEELIDVLTLLSNSGDKDEIDSFAEGRFYDALWLVYASRLDRADPFRAALTEKCIWRRCILQDDWAALNRTEGKTDEMILDEIHNTVLYKTLVRGLETNLFETHPPLHPRQINPAGESVAELRKSSRYETAADSFLSDLAKDHQREDDLLEEVLNQGRLDARWQGLIDVAKADIRDKQDRQGQLLAFKEAERQALEQAMKENRSAETAIAIAIEPEESQTQQGHPVGATNGVNDELEEYRENGVHTDSKVQTTPKKSKKKQTRKTKASKKQGEEEKENKDADGDVQMFA